MEEAENEELKQQIAEAEERGYRRGLNEQIAKAMEQPGVWEGSTSTPAGSNAPDEGYQILATPRRSIWGD